MKIKFLGSSHGYAEIGRYTSSTLIETNGTYYILDAGAPIDYLLVNHHIAYTDICGIFITHMHSDHVSNLPPITEAFTRYRYNDRCTCVLPEQKGLDGYLLWMETIHANVEKLKETIKFKVATPGVCFKDDNICVTAVPTGHISDDIPTYGYIFEAEGKKVYFTGDMAQDFPEYAENVAGQSFDLTVCEMAHAKLENVAETLKKTNTNQMLISHYHLPQIERHEEIFKTFPFPISLTYDGFEISL